MNQLGINVRTTPKASVGAPKAPHRSRFRSANLRVSAQTFPGVQSARMLAVTSIVRTDLRSPRAEEGIHAALRTRTAPSRTDRARAVRRGPQVRLRRQARPNRWWHAS